MKNSLNLVLVILLFVVIGCNCPNMDEISKKIDNASTPSSSTPSDSSSPSSSKGLSVEKYNKIKNGMTYKEVVEILGSEGQETMSSGEGKYKVESYKWEGEGFQLVTIVMTGGKVTSKFQANLK